jgi:hypothetical protein
MKALTTTEKAQLVNTITQSSLKRYCVEIYGPDAYSAEVRVHTTTRGTILNVQVLAWDEDDHLLLPDPALPYWKRVERESYTFEDCDTLMQRVMAADAYLFKGQIPLEYGIVPVSVSQITLHEIKCLDDIHLYIEDDLPEITIHLKNVEEKKELIHAGPYLA